MRPFTNTPRLTPHAHSITILLTRIILSVAYILFSPESTAIVTHRAGRGLYKGHRVGRDLYTGHRVERGLYTGHRVGRGLYGGHRVGRGLYTGHGA